MKRTKINPATISLLCCLCLITSCEKDSLLDVVSPQKGDQSEAHEMYAESWASNTLQSCPLDNETFVAAADDNLFNCDLNTTLRRELLDAGLTINSDPEKKSPPEVAPVDTRWGYTINGVGTIYGDTYGRAEVTLNIQSSPYVRTSLGKITIQSTSDSSSFVTYHLIGSSGISQMTSEFGFSFTVNAIESGGAFSSIDGSGTATLRTDVKSLDNQMEQFISHLEIRMEYAN